MLTHRSQLVPYISTDIRGHKATQPNRTRRPQRPLLHLPPTLLFYHPQWVTADPEIKVPSLENLELANVLPSRPGISYSIASLASPTARNFVIVLMSTTSSTTTTIIIITEDF